MMESIFETSFTNSIDVISKTWKHSRNELINSAKIIDSVLKSGNKVFCCGNGGSAADAQHFAAELVIRYEKKRCALPAIALTTDSSILTAGANDLGFDTIFSRQLEALGCAGDLLIAISTSGNSSNIINAINTAHCMKIRTVLLTGLGQGAATECNIDQIIKVQSNKTARIQEVHILILHSLCEIIERDN